MLRQLSGLSVVDREVLGVEAPRLRLVQSTGRVTVDHRLCFRGAERALEDRVVADRSLLGPRDPGDGLDVLTVTQELLDDHPGLVDQGGVDGGSGTTRHLNS